MVYVYILVITLQGRKKSLTMILFIYPELIGVTLCILAVEENYANPIVFRRRLCVEYEIQDYQSMDEPLQIINDTETRSRCMTQCVRNAECWAFNYHTDSGTCIVLPATGCMTLDRQLGYLYVHLSDCNMVPVREIRRPPDGRWRWVRTDSPASRNDLIKLPGQKIRYAGRVFIDGSYIPGWYLGSKYPFKGVSPDDLKFRYCPQNTGELLAFNDSSDYRFENFQAGSPVPDSAPVISALPDGTPLYVVRKSFSGAPGYDLIGYYNPVSQTNYFANNYPDSDKPSNVKILVLTWLTVPDHVYSWKFENTRFRLWMINLPSYNIQLSYDISHEIWTYTSLSYALYEFSSCCRKYDILEIIVSHKVR